MPKSTKPKTEFNILRMEEEESFGANENRLMKAFKMMWAQMCKQTADYSTVCVPTYVVYTYNYILLLADVCLCLTKSSPSSKLHTATVIWTQMIDFDFSAVVRAARPDVSWSQIVSIQRCCCCDQNKHCWLNAWKFTSCENECNNWPATRKKYCFNLLFHLNLYKHFKKIYCSLREKIVTVPPLLQNILDF